jgi:hypothetical protein
MRCPRDLDDAAPSAVKFIPLDFESTNLHGTFLPTRLRRRSSLVRTTRPPRLIRVAAQGEDGLARVERRLREWLAMTEKNRSSTLFQVGIPDVRPIAVTATCIGSDERARVLGVAHFAHLLPSRFGHCETRSVAINANADEAVVGGDALDLS